MAQATHDFVEKLDKAGLVTAFEKKAILKEIKERDDHLKKFDRDQFDIEYQREIMGQPHYILTVLMGIKKYSTAGTLGIHFRPAPVTIPKGKEKELKDYLNKFVAKLLTGKFISEKTAAEVLEKISLLELRSEYGVSDFVASATEKEYFLTPVMYKKFADSLLSRKLLEEKDYNEIIEKLGKDKFRNYDGPLKYIKNLIWVDRVKYKGKPQDYLEPVYRETSKVFPGLDFDSMSFSFEQDKRESSEGFTVTNIIVSLRKKNKLYRYRSFFDAAYKNKKEEDRLLLPENYYQVFNKILADQLSPYRLHLVSIDRKSFGILPLTKKQFDGLQWSYSGMNTGGYIALSYENFTNKINQKKIDEAIQLYDSIGLLSHLKKEERDSCMEEVMSKEINYYSDILSSFRNLVFEIDLEYGINDGQYKQLTEQIARISKGSFSPGKIIDTYNYEKGKSFEYGFTITGKKYLANLKQEDDWLDIGFWDLIEKAMAEQDQNGKFYYLHPADGMRQIYLTHQQAEILKQKRMIELEEKDLVD